MAVLSEAPPRARRRRRSRRSDPPPPPSARPEMPGRVTQVVEHLRDLADRPGAQTVTAAEMHAVDRSVSIAEWHEVLEIACRVGQPPQCRRDCYVVAAVPLTVALGPAGWARAQQLRGGR